MSSSLTCAIGLAYLGSSFECQLEHRAMDSLLAASLSPIKRQTIPVLISFTAMLGTQASTPLLEDSMWWRLAMLAW